MKKTLMLILVLLLAVAAVWWIARDAMYGGAVDENGNATGTSSDAQSILEKLQAQVGDGGTVELVSGATDAIPEGVPIPSLDRPITFPKSYDNNPDARRITRETIESLSEELKGDPTRFSTWIDLGIYRKGIEDYEGAAEAWKFAGEIRPQNNISFHNLGDLYHFFLKDFPKSEQAFKQAIQNDPTYVPSYLSLADLYKYSYKTDTDLGALTLLDGIRVNGESVAFLSALGSYYKELGDKAKAIEYYQKAFLKAKADGNTELQSAYEREIRALGG